MSSYAIYGISSYDLNEVAASLGDQLNIKWVPHESSYIGDYYRSGTLGAENFVLQPNRDPLEEVWMEPDHAEYPILLYVNNTERLDKLNTVIMKFALAKIALLKNSTKT